MIHTGTMRTQTPGSEQPRSGDPEGSDLRMSFLDPEPCPGTSVSYALMTVQLDRVEGVEVRRSAMSETVTHALEPRFEIRVLGFAAAPAASGSAPPSPSGSGASPVGVPRVRLEILDLRIPARLGESSGAPLDDAGATLGIKTDWTLVEVETETRDEILEIAVPRFEDDGSRTLENGAPAFRKEQVERPVPYPVVRLRDRCGQEKVLRVGAPAETPVR